MPPSQNTSAETLLIDLVHDLRQHLGNIETSLYCLNLLNETAAPLAHGHLRTIEAQVKRAGNRLSEAGTAVRRLRSQRADEAKRDMTNSTSGLLT
jgi:hypothetical protein